MFIAPLSEAVLVIKAAAISADRGGVLSHDIKWLHGSVLLCFLNSALLLHIFIMLVHS